MDTPSPPHNNRSQSGLGSLPSNITLHALAADSMPTRLADDIAQRLQTALHARGKAVLSVSGGTSPIALFQALRTHALDWTKVVVTLVDERCVPSHHPHSNAHLVNTHLLQDAAAHATAVPMLSQAVDAHDVAAQAEWAAQQLRLQGPADVLVLGMGADGHTASLFPHAPNLQAALDRHNTQVCTGVTLPDPPAHAPYARITQTLAQLLTARHIVLPLHGEDKRGTLQRAASRMQDDLPISHVLHQTQTPVAIWMAE